jgi:hypothetical protein
VFYAKKAHRNIRNENFVYQAFSEVYQNFKNTNKNRYLKVPKREIFDRSDFPDFYNMKSLRVGDFGFKINKNLQIFRGAKFLTRMLSVFLRRFF